MTHVIEKIVKMKKSYEIELNQKFIEKILDKVKKDADGKEYQYIKDLNLTTEEIKNIIWYQGEYEGIRPEVENVVELLYILCMRVIDEDSQEVSTYEDDDDELYIYEREE